MLIERLYTAEQIRELDQKAILQQFTGDGYGLMYRAGQAAFKLIQASYPQYRQLIIFCGQGNNGGDGFVIASLAAEQQYQVTVFFIGDNQKQSKDSSRAYNAYKQYTEQNDSAFKLINVAKDNDLDLDNTDDCLIIDALLGTGLSNAPRGCYQTAIEYINQLKRDNNNQVFAIDIPSGLSADTGVASIPTILADKTITFIAVKQGLLTSDGPDCCGELLFDDLGLNDNIFRQVDNSSWLINKAWVNKVITEYLPARKKNSHKHQFGHVVLVGGDSGMPGAITMAAQASLRAGSGLVTVISNSEHCIEINLQQLELMVYGVTNDLEQHQIKLYELLEKAAVLVIGPGLGQSDWSHQIFKFMVDYLLNINKENNKLAAVVIDADGLTLLAKEDDERKQRVVNKLKELKISVVLTPHPGEAARLLDLPSTKAVAIDRFTAATNIVKQYKAIVVLKGVGSLIAGPEQQTALCNLGNPGMASAGMGDILTGIVAGLIAQKLDCYDATCLAVYIHAKLADLQTEQYGERGLCATDLLLELRNIINQGVN